MLLARKQRLIFLICLIIAASTAIGLALFALQQNINLFYSPSQVAAGQAPRQHTFRIGGIVTEGSLHHQAKTLVVEFSLTDKRHQVTVWYNGILPTLFREGQGIVAEGRLNQNGVFIADQILAKHDANYMPPEVATSLAYATRTR